MGESSKIEWTDASWNPIRARLELSRGREGAFKVGWHCTHASEGCRFCYAEVMNRRLGTGFDYKPGHEKDIEIFLDEKMLLAPLRWKRPRKIFVGSMTDLFADFVKDEWLDRIFAVMALCPQHTFQLLTKRPERMRAYMAHPDHAVRWFSIIDDKWARAHEPLSLRKVTPNAHLENVWLGTSCEDQPTADERIPHLLATPAAIRFLSLEPLLGKINLSRAAPAGQIDWVIVGGESGPQARSFSLSWAKSIIRQCRETGVPCFVKQIGANAWDDISYLDATPQFKTRSGKGGDMDEWPQELRVREFPR